MSTLILTEAVPEVRCGWDSTRGVSMAISYLGSSVTPHSWVSLGRGLALSSSHLLLQGITGVPVGSPPSEIHITGLSAHTATVTVI